MTDLRRYKKGAEWRIWDFHVHSPASYSGNYQEFVKRLASCKAEVIGICDYCTIAGYEEVLKLGLPNKIIFPVVEFRMNNMVLDKDDPLLKTGVRINFHILFSNDTNILPRIKTWLNSLKCICEGGKHEQLGNITDPQEYSKLSFDYFKIIESIESDDQLIAKHMIVLPYDEYGGIDNIDPEGDGYFKLGLIGKAHVIGSANKKQIDFFLFKHKKHSYEQIEKWLNGRKKPCIKGSDAHEILYPYGCLKDEKSKPIDKFCWIKADPTFEGFKQIIYEPEERIFIGDEPELLKRVKENPTKFIKAIRINQVNSYNEKLGIWFKNIEIPFNPGLVAIIGNRGSGKSAIADILGLSGNSHQYDNFSFLNKRRFLKDGLAENFEAEMEWESGERVSKNLIESVDNNAPERIRYFPQFYFEELTNNLETYEFEKTLENVVFTHVPVEQKLGKNTFKELIEYKQQSANNEISQIMREIRILNEQIIELEKKNHPNYLEQIDNKLKLKKEELKQHNKNKPEEVKSPKEDKELSEEQRKMFDKLELLNKALEETEKDIEQYKKRKSQILQEIEDLENIRRELEQHSVVINKYIVENMERFKKYGLNLANLFRYEINFDAVDTKIKQKKSEISEIKRFLFSSTDINRITEPSKQDVLKKVSLKVKNDELLNEINNIRNKLSKQEKQYQRYIEELKTWKLKEKAIIGNPQTLDTIKWLEEEIKFVNSALVDEMQKLRDQRIEKSLQIYNKNSEILNVFTNFKNFIDTEISKYRNILGDYEINIEVSLKIKQIFYDKFLSYIDQRNSGSFFGKDEGYIVLKELVDKVDMSLESSVSIMFKELINHLEIDQRSDYKNVTRFITEQIKEEDLEDFYDYVFSMEYLIPFYELKLGNKSLPQLSPGERGAMLIVFYLMLDKDNIPLIIDQPEENLDNESIYKILTHFFKYAKRSRQIIIVTHNPNLAIVGDAEEIIFVNIDKKNDNQFNYESGSIENDLINKRASDVLEGTLKAFDIRKLKYFKK